MNKLTWREWFHWLWTAESPNEKENREKIYRLRTARSVVVMLDLSGAELDKAANTIVHQIDLAIDSLLK